MTDLTGHFDDPSCLDASAPTAADAAVLQLAGEASPRDLADSHGFAPAQDVRREEVRAILVAAIPLVAPRKDIRISSREIENLATCLVASFSSGAVEEILRGEGDVYQLLDRMIESRFDKLEGEKILRLLWASQTETIPSEDEIGRAIYLWLHHPVANHIGSKAFRWPSAEMVGGYIRSIAKRPVNITLPENARAWIWYQLDPVRCRAVSKDEPNLLPFPDETSGPDRPRVPLIIHCPLLPAVPERFRNPDQKHASRRAKAVKEETDHA